MKILYSRVFHVAKRDGRGRKTRSKRAFGFLFRENVPGTFSGKIFPEHVPGKFAGKMFREKFPGKLSGKMFRENGPGKNSGTKIPGTFSGKKSAVEKRDRNAPVQKTLD